MKKRSLVTISSATTFARGVVYLAAIAAIAVLTILLPELAREEAAGKANPPITWPFFVAAFILAAPFFIALFQTHKLLQNIDEHKAFSIASVRLIENIKKCAMVFSVLVCVTIIGGAMLLRLTNPAEDAPPFFLFGFVLTFVSGVITAFLAVLQKLLAEAVEMKSENDLIV